MKLMLGIDPTGGLDPWSEAIVWSTEFWYSQYKPISLTATASSTQATLYLASKALHPFKHCDAYFDDVSLTIEAGDGDPAPGPDPGGYPARAMVVAYGLIPDRLTRRDLYQLASDQGITVTPSHDHAQAWPPGARSYTIDVYNVPEHHKNDLRSYYRPDIDLNFQVHTETPPPPPPPPTPVDPPAGGEGEPSPYPLRSKCLIGLHSGFRGEKSDSYLRTSRTTIQKHFTAGDCWHVKTVDPRCITIWRRYVGNEEGRIGEKPTIRESAQWYLDLYSEEIETAAHNLGLTVSQLLSCIDGIESLNETIPTRNRPQLRRSVEFDVDFAELCAERYGDELVTVLSCGAVGNPDVDEVDELLPAAAAVHSLGGFLGYHPYWTCNEATSFLETHWQYHAGRWMEWDKTFTAAGYYPRYALGEGGCVYAWDGVNFNSGLGWKSCGDIEAYLVDIAKWNARANTWNAVHANRCAGIALFGYCNWGWDNFELGHGDVDLIARWAATL